MLFRSRLQAQIQQSAEQTTEAPVQEKEPGITEKEPETKEDNSKTTDSAEVEPVVDIPNEDVAVMESGPNVSNMSFDQESGIIWPIGSDSDVLMNYSVDSTIYFKTLGQYKTNPALIISAEEGANVCSATQAVVTEVGENEEIGKFVETSIGDEYKIIYGQLDSILVENGTTLDEGEIVGTIGSPTKYYVEEGSNLYMQMTCADETVDPMIFLH